MMSQEKSEKNLRERIMNEGFPLQRNTSKVLHSLGWLADEEYPVTQEIKWQGMPSDVVDTYGDLTALYLNEAKDYSLRTCISCKRQQDIDWAFMKSMNAETVHTFVRLCSVKDSEERDDFDEFDYRFHSDKSSGFSYSLCNIATNLIRRREQSRKGRDENKIQQTCENLCLELLQCIQDDRKTFLYHTDKSKQIIYIPTIITAAKISVYDVNEGDFDVADDKAITLDENIPYTLYCFRMPRNMHWSISLSDQNAPMNLDKLYIFVVYYKYTETFYRDLMRYFETADMTLPTHS